MTEKPRHSGEPDRSFIAVYELPEKVTDGYCFSARPITFLNVDWFTVADKDDIGKVREFIQSKRYYHPAHRYLVLSLDDPKWTFTIEKVRQS